MYIDTLWVTLIVIRCDDIPSDLGIFVEITPRKYSIGGYILDCRCTIIDVLDYLCYSL